MIVKVTSFRKGGTGSREVPGLPREPCGGPVPIHRKVYQLYRVNCLANECEISLFSILRIGTYIYFKVAGFSKVRQICIIEF